MLKKTAVAFVSSLVIVLGLLTGMMLVIFLTTKCAECCPIFFGVFSLSPCQFTTTIALCAGNIPGGRQGSTMQTLVRVLPRFYFSLSPSLCMCFLVYARCPSIHCSQFPKPDFFLTFQRCVMLTQELASGDETYRTRQVMRESLTSAVGELRQYHQAVKFGDVCAALLH